MNQYVFEWQTFSFNLNHELIKYYNHFIHAALWAGEACSLVIP